MLDFIKKQVKKLSYPQRAHVPKAKCNCICSIYLESFCLCDNLLGKYILLLYIVIVINTEYGGIITYYYWSW